MSDDRSADKLRQISVSIGARMRARRRQLDMSLEALGQALGLAYQQVQKYEKGDNRISAARLYDAAEVLQVPITYFFEGLPEALEKPALLDGLEAGTP